ncbi:unnamed protein product [Timema podura]|uniref:Peptidase S1 domain-containing protein n=1 Tax=Timema podura TaxID=61482 RepID=A0ABN7NTZ9_TIMPD|nr:unnamed protein product [Timema podura]
MYFTLACCIIVMAILNQVMAYPLKVNVNNTCECGHLVHVEDRIVGGSMTTPHLYPWMVAILNGGRLHCGGSAINNLYILTAGHCLKWANKDELVVVLGMHDRVQMEEGTEKFVKIDSLIIHESFTSDYLHDTDDIGLVKLKEPIVWDETIQPICLPKPVDCQRAKINLLSIRPPVPSVMILGVVTKPLDKRIEGTGQLVVEVLCKLPEVVLDTRTVPVPVQSSDYRGKLGMVTGWGRTAQNGNPARYLRRAGVKIVHEDRCKNTTIGDHIRETMSLRLRIQH